jgi:probable phosphoglycerate mutase
MLRIFLLRHGETDYNKRRIVQGSGVDASLNDEGIFQAQKFFEKYKNVPFEAVYCSTLKRTYETLKPFEILYPIQKDPALNELSWGIIEGQEFEGKTAELYWAINQAWEKGDAHKKLPNGDSPLEVWNRVNNFISNLRKKHRSNVLICTHGRTLKILFSFLTGYSLKYQNLFNHHNSSLSILRFLDENHFIVEKFNDLSHLEL